MHLIGEFAGIKVVHESLLHLPTYQLSDPEARIQTARLSATRAVNRDLVLLYWDIGRAIVEKQKLLNWGDSVVEMVAKDLQKEFPAMVGFSQANVWRMRQLHMVYSSEAILAQAERELETGVPGQGRPSFLEQVVPEGTKVRTGSAGSPNLAQVVRDLVAAVPWGHHVLLLGRTKAPPELLYYIRATARFGWSRNVLLNQIKVGAYERAVTEKKTHNFPLAFREYLAEQALIAANRELIERFEKKIQATLARVWGENEPASAEA